MTLVKQPFSRLLMIRLSAKIALCLLHRELQFWLSWFAKKKELRIMLKNVCVCVLVSFASIAFSQEVPSDVGKTILDGLLADEVAKDDLQRSPLELAEEELEAAKAALDDLPKVASAAERRAASARVKAATAALEDEKRKEAELEKIAKAIKIQQEVVEQFVKAIPEEWFYGRLLNAFPVKEGGPQDPTDLTMPTQLGRLLNGGIVPQSATSFTLPNWKSFFSLGTESFVAADFNLNGRTPFILIGTQKGVSGFESQKRLKVVFLPIDKIEQIKAKFIGEYLGNGEYEKNPALDFWKSLPPVMEQQNPVNRAWAYNGSGAGLFLIMGTR
jgi:hypothetical protein